MGPNYYVEPPRQSFIPQGKMLYLIIGGIVAVLLGVGLMVATNGSKKDLSLQLSYLNLHIASLQAVLDDNETTRNIQNQELDNIVQNYNLTLTTDANNLKTAGMPAEVSEKIIAGQPQDTALDDIKEAALKNRRDQEIRKILLAKIQIVRADTAAIYPQVSSMQLKAALKDLDTDLSDMATKLEKLNL